MTWTKEEIGRIIKESRISAGLTQSQVAQALGRPQNTISAWEVGRAQPDANTLFELFELFHRSVDEAFGFSSPNSTEKNSPSERIHIKKYRTLDEHGKDVVDTLLDKEYERCAALQQPEESIALSDECLVQRGAQLVREQLEKEKKRDASASYAQEPAVG